ncbi:dynamin family protein [Mycetocola miduiensis]|uniref:dynamin family protein n=1 Tax=Mycetocola miduiensis TaxID=995034 RepID=UPI000B857C50|nr:dynamin family protein [Mycetocola miduiensis]
MVELVRLVEQGVELARDGERPDLRKRLELTRQRLLDPSIRVIVVGEFKQGKSQLINALVNAPVCPVDDDIATSVPTVVRYGSPPSALILVPREGAGSADEPVLERRQVALEELPSYVSERGNPDNTRRLMAAEIFLPRKILLGGLSLVDSPGVGGLDSTHSVTTFSTLPTADAMLFVSDASQEYTEPEMQFLKQALRISPNVACVLAKTDLYPQWREVAELNRAHLDRLGTDIRLFPVSSDVRLTAARLGDSDLNTESGFPELVAFLRNEIVGKAERLQTRSVAQDLMSVTEHLSLSLQAELRALENPEGTPQMIVELEAAKAKADELRQRSARWQITLNDGMGDLIADMDHDLRERMRSIQREAEAAIDAGDPGPMWDQLAGWLIQRVAAGVSDTFVWTNERAQWLSGEVANHFAHDDVPLPVIRVDDTEDVLDPVELMPTLDPGTLGVMQKVLIGARGSYGGVLMVGLLTGIVGMSLINPFSIAAGLLIGGKAFRDDKEARLQRRRAEAKQLVRRQIDDVIFQVGKQLKDRLRLIQRATRDHFTEIAEEHHRSLTDSVLAAQKAANSFTQERAHRITEIKLELKRVGALRSQAPSVRDKQPVRAASA